MNHLLALYHLLQSHPLYWQVPLGLLTTSGIFEYLKRRVGLTDPKRITGYLSLLAVAEVIIHGAIVGLTFAGPAGYLKGYGSQLLFVVGALNLIYTYATHGLTKFLLDAKAQADAGKITPATQAQKNQAVTAQAVAAGVAPF